VIFSLESSNLPQKTVDGDLIKRFTRVFRESGLSQSLFGKRIGQKQNAISQVLSGDREPSKAMLQAVITEFDVSPAWIMGGEGEPFSVTKEAPAAGPYVTEKDFAEWRGLLAGRDGSAFKTGGRPRGSGPKAASTRGVRMIPRADTAILLPRNR
jgi:transcriptional regulator with XRE-family HTH domain